jgi:hypothetical protein
MAKTPLHELVAKYLNSRLGERLTIDEVAAGVIAMAPSRFAAKGQALGGDKALLNQVTREIYSQRPSIISRHPELSTDTSRSPMLVFAEPTQPDEIIKAETIVAAPISPGTALPDPTALAEEQREHDLYGPIRTYLYDELGIMTRRIRESTSGNRRGKNGNKWLHPDIVGMKMPGRQWSNLVNQCVSALPTRKAELFSIEVKVRLTSGNLREAFFQTVSNSLWANYAYLIATEVKGEDTYIELQTLCGLHGVGYLTFDPKTPEASRIVIPARKRDEVDWASVDRIAKENADFTGYLERVHNYLQTGQHLSTLWAAP